MKPLAECANGDGRPVMPPSKVICKECMDRITAQMEEMLARLEQREREGQK